MSDFLRNISDVFGKISHVFSEISHISSRFSDDSTRRFDFCCLLLFFVSLFLMILCVALRYPSSHHRREELRKLTLFVRRLWKQKYRNSCYAREGNFSRKLVHQILRKRVGKQKRSNRIFCCFLISVWSWRGLNPRPNGEPTSFLHA